MPDLGVYNLDQPHRPARPGPHASSPWSASSRPLGQIDDKGEIKVTEEDNAMVLLDHGNGVLSHVQCGFNYFNPHGHDGSDEKRATRSRSSARRAAWGMSATTGMPLGVDFATGDHPTTSDTSPTPRATSGSKERRWSPSAWPPARNR